MSKEISEHDIEQLRIMIESKKPNEPIEELLTIFCQRYGKSLDACHQIYQQLIEKGKIKEK